MKVYRGPSSLPFWDNRHEFVSQVEAEVLEQGIRDGAFISFNITKDRNERAAVCTVRFDEDDVIPLIEGLLGRLKAQQAMTISLRALLQNAQTDADTKIIAIKDLLSVR